jgi:hypothetical protein
MSEKFRPFFERTLAEQSELIQPQVLRIQQENLAHGLYNSYRTENYPNTDTFVRQYSDHSEVIRIDAATGKTEKIKTL